MRFFEKQRPQVAAFKPGQDDLPIQGTGIRDQSSDGLKEAVLPALDDMTAAIRHGGLDSVSLQILGQAPVVIDRAGAERIHAAAKALKQRKRKDPG